MIKKLLSDDLLRHSGIVGLGYGASSLLGLIFFAIGARVLGPGDFGIFSVAVAVTTIITDLVDSGLNSSIINSADKEHSKNDLEVIFSIKTVLAVLLVVLSFPIGWVTAIILKEPRLFFPIVIGVSSIGTNLFYNLLSYRLQAKKMFVKFSAMNSVSNIFRLGMLGILVLVFQINNLYSVLIAFLFAPLFSAIIFWRGVFSGDSKLRINFKTQNIHFWSFGKNLSLSFAIATISSRFDVFFLQKLAGAVETGLYNAPLRLFAPTQQIAGALATVQAPHLASSEGNWKQVFLKGLLIASLASLALFICSFFANLILQVFGPEYSSSAQVFRFLAIAFSLFFLRVPFSSALIYRMQKSQYLVFNSISSAVVFASFLYFFVPQSGGSGAAIALCFSNAFSLILDVTVFLKNAHD